MRRGLLYGSLVVLAFLIAYCAIAPDPGEGHRAGEWSEIITRVETFKRDKGRLPASLSELGIEEKEAGPHYYLKEGGGNYVLWLRTEKGEVISYDSESRKWQQK